MSSRPLKITTIQAQNSNFVIENITRYIGRTLGISVEFVIEASWVEREQRLDNGDIDLGWICGLPYVIKVDRESPTVELLVAPVMQATRYRDEPIYFSDVIVHRDSRFQAFSDLRGASWAYNEPNSQSGYNITRYHLARSGEMGAYFGKVMEAGAHQIALDMIVNQQIDASAIDSTVLELEIALHPEIKKQIRIIDTWGPSPIPPWVVHKSLDRDLKRSIQKTLLEMHTDPVGADILEQGQFARFVSVTDKDYNPIRKMVEIAQMVKL